MDVVRGENDALISAIEQVRRRNRWIVAGLGAVMVGFAAMCGLGFGTMRGGEGERYGIAAVLAGLGLFLLRGEKAPAVDPVVAVLRHRAGEIVWIYAIDGVRSDSSLVIGLADGTTVVARIPRKRESELVHLAAARSPQARLGYAPDVEAQFHRDPASLRGPVSVSHPIPTSRPRPGAQDGGGTEKHLPMLAQVLRSAQERWAVFGGVLLLLGAGFQLISWTGTGSAGEKLGIALVSGALTGVPGLLLLRRGFRRVPPLLRRLEHPQELGAIRLIYLAGSDGTTSCLEFVFRDQQAWSVELPADVGKAMYRDFATAYPWVTTGERT